MKNDDGMRARPRRVSGWTRVAAVAAFAGIVAAVGPAGWASAATPAAVEPAAGWAWGDNGYGQLCDGDSVRQASPVTMSGVDGVTQVAAGFALTVLLHSDGTVWACGDNEVGGLGNGTTVANSAVPVQVTGLTDVVQVAAGGNFGLALRADGTVATWGNTLGHAVGDGSTPAYRNTPVTVPGLTDVIQIGASVSHAIALRADGTVMAWGTNIAGELGNNTVLLSDTPMLVDGLTGVTQIATHGLHNLALLTDGTVMAWGNNIAGQVGPASTATSQYTPVAVTGLSGVTQVAAGIDHSLALLSDGTVAAWGLNAQGALGDGTTTTRSTPAVIDGLTDVKQISAGNMDSLALRADGTVAAWGGNAYGQLGDGTTTKRLTPFSVPGLSDVTQVSGGAYQTAAITGGRGPALTPLVHPIVLGTARVGGTMVAVPGVFSPWAGTYRYQWLRDGSPIEGASKPWYSVTAADSRHSLSVWVVAVRVGYANGTAISPAVAVAGPSDAVVGQ